MSTVFWACLIKALVLPFYAKIQERLYGKSLPLGDGESSPEHPKWGGDLRRSLPGPKE